MKTLYQSLLLSLFLFGQLYAQNLIQGTVSDAKTNELLPFANVYINNTTKGVQTDDKGNFLLNNPPLGTVQLVVSYLGYNPFQQTLIVEANKPLSLTVRLIPVANMLTDVEVKAKRDKEWERNLKIFKREFLGELSNANKCEILNAWAVDFQESNGELQATAQRPVEVENKALGYKLYINLLDFRTSVRGYRYLANTRFEELLPKDEKEKKRWLNNRRETFKGSSRQFFKSLYHNILDKDGYTVYRMEARADWTSTNVWQPSKPYQKGINLVTNSAQLLKDALPNQKALVSELPFEVSESRRFVTVGSQNVLNANPVTRMRLLRATMVSPDGLLSDPNAVEMIGYWGNERVADLLPNDYFVENQIGTVVEVMPEIKGQKVYLHTNKAAYTTQEKIWYSAYITETGSNHLWKEPQPLYVQLYEKDGFLVKTETIFTQAGRGAGYFAMPDGLINGVYRLRAFTKLSLNNPAQVFEKPLSIVNPRKPVGIVIVNENYSQGPKDSLQLVLKTSQDKYAPREKITLNLSAFLGEKTMKGSFSVSVVDADIVLKGDESFDILSYLATDKPLKNKVDGVSDTEKALTYTGLIQNQDSKLPMPNASAVLLLTDNNKTYQRTIKADDKGRFVLDNVDFDGIQVMAYQVNNAKGRAAQEGEILIEPSLPKVRLAPVRFDTISLSQNQQRLLQTSTPDGEAFVMPSDGVNLDEVKISTKPPEIDPNEVGIVKLYNDPTFSAKFDEKSPRFATVYDMMVGTLPGVQVATFDDNGQQKYKVLIRGISTFNAAAIGATIVLDGMQVSQETLLQGVNPNDVMKIDVLSGPNAAIFGSNGGNGVIAIYTRRFRERYSGISSAKTLMIKGYQLPESFYVPDYQTPKPEHKNSDNRTTIYWNPMLETSANGEATASFFAADAPARYKVVVEGITPSGIAGRAEKWIEVR